MKQKTFWKVLALVLVLVLTIGILAACNNQGNTPGVDEGDEGGGEVTPPATISEHVAFFDTMFSSANEIGDATVSLAEGQNVAMNVGLTLSLAVGGNNLPIGISLKGLLDRENVRVTSFVEDTADSKTGKWVWCNDYIDYEEAKHTGWERFTLNGENYDEDANGNYVKNIVEYNSSKAAHKADDAVRYKGATFALTAENETVIDLCIKAQGVDSLRVYYEMGDTNSDNEARGIMYVTLAGNKFKVDLNDAAATDNGMTSKIEDALFNLVNNVVLGNSIVQSIVGSFGENFDLNNLISGLLLPVIKNIQVSGQPLIPEGKTLADSLLDEKGLGGIDLAGMTVKSIVTQLFGTEANVRQYLGETLDIQSLLKQVSKMLFNSPKWYVYNADGSEKTKPTNSYDLVKENLKQKLKAEIQLGGSLGSKAKAMTFLDGNSSLTLGFTKEAGTDTSVGKMDSFYLKLFLSKINAKKDINISISIDDLAFGATNDVVPFTKLTTAEKDAYGAFTFDAGMELDLSEEIISIVFRREDKADAGFDTFTDADYEVVLGENNEGNSLISADGKTAYLPKNLTLSVKGALDFASPAGTKVVINLIAKAYSVEGDNVKDFTIATAQLSPTADNKSLQFDVKAYDTKLVPFIMEVLANQANIINNNGDIAGFTKYNGKWGWWHDGKELITLADGFTEVEKSSAITTGVYYQKSVDGKTYTKIEDVSAITDGTKIYKLKENLAVPAMSTDFVAVREGANYYNAKLYKKSGDNYVVAEEGCTEQLYILKSAYEAAAVQDTITELYKEGKVCYATSRAINNFVESGEMRITGINLYNLLFLNQGIGQVLIDEYYYLGNEGYETAVAAEAGDGSWDILKNFLLATKRDKGILSVIGNLLAYNKSTGTLTIGSDNVMDKLFGATGVYDFVDKEGYTANVFSVLGYLVDNSLNNIFTSYFKTESSLIDLVNRGIEVYGGYNPYIRLDRADGVESAGEKALYDWNNSTNAEEKVTAITKLEALGYKLVNVNDTTAVIYPLFIFNNKIEVWANDYTLALAKNDEADIKNYLDLLNNDGFVVSEIDKATYDENKDIFGYYTKTVYNADGDATTKYVRLTSKSVEELIADWKAAEAEGADTTALRTALFRRGIATRKYQNSSDEWQYYTENVVMDEGILLDTDATIELYTTKNAAKTVITDAGIKMTINYCDAEAVLNLYMHFAPASITLTEGEVDDTSIGFNENLLTNPVENTFSIQIVKY